MLGFIIKAVLGVLLIGIVGCSTVLQAAVLFDELE